MKKYIAIALGALIALPFVAYNVGSANPLLEDNNGNTIPDVIEINHGTFQVFKTLSPGFTLSTAVIIITIVTAIYVTIQRRNYDYRDNREASLKIYKSKYKVIGMKISAFVVCLVMFGFLTGIASATIFEDFDGDGVPDVIENCIYMNSTVNPETIESGDTTNVELSVDYNLDTKAPLDVVLVLDKSLSMALPVGAEKEVASGKVSGSSPWTYTTNVNDISYLKVYILNKPDIDYWLGVVPVDDDSKDKIIVRLKYPNGTLAKEIYINDDNRVGTIEVMNPVDGSWTIEIEKNWDGSGSQEFDVFIYKVPEVLPRFEGTISNGEVKTHTFNITANMDYLDIIVHKDTWSARLKVTVSGPGYEKTKTLWEYIDVVDVFHIENPQKGTWEIKVECLEGSSAEYDVFTAMPKIGVAKMAMKSFIDKLGSDDRVAIVSFGSSANLELNFTNDFDQAKNVLESITVEGSTDIYQALELSNNWLIRYGNDYAEWAIIVLSDGWDLIGSDPREQANVSKEYGIKIYTIGYALTVADVEEILRDISDMTGGQYYYAPSDETLEEIYQSLKEDIKVNATVTFKLSDSVEFVDATGGYQRENKTITWYIEELPWQASITVKPIKIGRVKINADNGSYLKYTVEIGHTSAEGIKYFNDTYVFVDVCPVVNLTAPSSVVVGNVEFNVVAYDPDGGNVNWTLNFGDGESMNGTNNQTVTHVYDQAGNYNVTLIARDDEENKIVIVRNVTVYNNPPEINVNDSYEVNEGKPLTFTVTASDPDGHNVTVLAENLPENASFDGHTFTWTPSYDFVSAEESPKTVTVTFKAVDEYGAFTVRTVTITVNNVNRAPSLTVTPESRTVYEGNSTTINVSATDPDGDNVTVYWSCNKLGVTDEPLTDNEWTYYFGYDFVQHPNKNRSVTVTFKATDEYGAYTTKTVNITVKDVNRAPIIDKIEGKRTVNENETATLTVTACDPDGDEVTVTWSSPELGVDNEPLPGSSWTYYFGYDFVQHPDTNRTVNITFTASDGKLSDSVTVEIIVNDTNRAPNVSIIADKNVVTVGEEVIFTVTVNDEDGDTIHITIDYGDGSSDEKDLQAGTSTLFSHSFASSGEYNVTVRANDSEDVDYNNTTIIVNNNSPPQQTTGNINVNVTIENKDVLISNLYYIGDAIPIMLNITSEDGQSHDVTVVVKVNGKEIPPSGKIFTTPTITSTTFVPNAAGTYNITVCAWDTTDPINKSCDYMNINVYIKPIQ